MYLLVFSICSGFPNSNLRTDQNEDIRVKALPLGHHELAVTLSDETTKNEFVRSFIKNKNICIKSTVDFANLT